MQYMILGTESRPWGMNNDSITLTADLGKVT